MGPQRTAGLSRILVLALVVVGASFSACGEAEEAPSGTASVATSEPARLSGSVTVIDADWARGQLRDAFLSSADTDMNPLAALLRIENLEETRARVPDAQRRYEELLELAAGADCSDGLGGGYSDISSDSQLQIRDERGTLIATSNLGAGEVTVLNDTLGCSFSFITSDFPEEVEFVEVALPGEQRGS